MRKRLVESAKTEGYSYGIVVRRLSGKTATLAYRVSELNSASFKKISAVSDQRIVYTEVAPFKSASFLI